MRHNPTDPEYLKAEEGDTNIPDPIIVPVMKLEAEKRPISLFNSTVFLSK